MSAKRRKLEHTGDGESSPVQIKKSASKPKAAAPSRTSRPAAASEPRRSHEPSKRAHSEVSDDDEQEEQDSEEAEKADDAAITASEDVGVEKTFADLGVIDSLCDACASLGFTKPTAIQRESIPIALQGKDIIGLAETGSGKTAAFALPILQALLDKPQPMFGLVLAPTRELAYQISQQFEALGSLINVRCAVVVGGMDMVPQAISLAKKPHIVVATPGRLLDHLENTKGFSLRQLKYLVMDEADRLLDLDFGPILDKILQVLPRERRTMLFSATMSTKLNNLTRAALQQPVRVSISSSSYQTVKNLMQRYIFIPHKFKDIYMVYLLNEFAGQTCIVFTRTINETQRIAFLLRALGRSAIPLHGQMNQSARLGALNKFRGGSRDILVATDVAARGLDIPSVDLVLNFDLPPDSKTYVHRVGRTARAGKSGVAISIVTQYDIEVYQRIEHALGKKLEEYAAERDEVMVFAPRVAEAQRIAITEMKNEHEKKKGKKGGIAGGRAKKGGSSRRDDMDVDEG
ncbi:ATP-dependent rRNA helicase rrp3 [Lecanosticta acicola]|uniref:ATP-dependent rRNA helicase rrp3 n=1 Tax=Lecanosticta acicola TaxID=111012 RepID=A0AAI8YSN2_9PEZI|nr:ATP-dependent rRNA helicase rrp3 [Lecanosticta acicola]